MGQNKKQRILELNQDDRIFLSLKVLDIINRFDLMDNFSEEKKFEMINEFSQDMMHNLILKINKENFANVFTC